MANARNRRRRQGRRPAFRDPKPIILVVSEGEVTEPGPKAQKLTKRWRAPGVSGSALVKDSPPRFPFGPGGQPIQTNVGPLGRKRMFTRFPVFHGFALRWTNDAPLGQIMRSLRTNGLGFGSTVSFPVSISSCINGDGRMAKRKEWVSCRKPASRRHSRVSRVNRRPCANCETRWHWARPIGKPTLEVAQYGLSSLVPGLQRHAVFALVDPGGEPPLEIIDEFLLSSRKREYYGEMVDQGALDVVEARAEVLGPEVVRDFLRKAIKGGSAVVRHAAYRIGLTQIGPDFARPALKEVHPTKAYLV